MSIVSHSSFSVISISIGHYQCGTIFADGAVPRWSCIGSLHVFQVDGYGVLGVQLPPYLSLLLSVGQIVVSALHQHVVGHAFIQANNVGIWQHWVSPLLHSLGPSPRPDDLALRLWRNYGRRP